MKAGMFSGRQSHRGKSRTPVAWVAFVEETKRMKPTDKAIVRMVSESPDRNASEPRSGLDKINPKAEPSLVGRRQHGMAQTDRSDMSLRRGGRDSTVARTCRATGEAVLVPSRNRWSKVDRITGKTGKASEGETVAARPVVAEKRGNARGAKGPCGTGSLDPEGRQRGDDQGPYPSAGPETKTIHPGEDRTDWAVLGTVRPGLQSGRRFRKPTEWRSKTTGRRA